MSNESTGEGSASFWLQHGQSLVAMFIALSVAMSIAYQLGFLFAIDISLVAFFTLQDAVVGALNFVPLAIGVAAILFFVIYVYMPWAKIFNVKAASIPPASVPQRVEKPTPKLREWLFALGGIALMFYFSIFYGLLIFGFAVGDYIQRLSARNPTHLKGALNALLVAMLFSFCMGGLIAESKLHSGESDYVMETAKGPEPIVLLRVGSEFLIVKTQLGYIRVIPRSSVVQLASIKPVTTSCTYCAIGWF